MPVCVDCKKTVLIDYQEIHTKRKSTVCICNSCVKKYQRRKEADSARDN